MSTFFLATGRIQRATLHKSFTPPAWSREPLLHFVLLGLVLFGIDAFVIGRSDDPRIIVVGTEVDDEAKQLFKSSRGRDPNPQELDALRRVWLDNEVLYREGLALQVDKGDSAIRERVIFKALSVVDANVKLPPIDEQTLREWFASHREKYDEPARYDFQEAVLSGAATSSEVRRFAESLNADVPGDVNAGLRVYKGRPHSNLIQSFGTDFPTELEAAASGKWGAVQTRDGWRAMRLDSKSAAAPAVFESVRGMVLQDWKDAAAADQRSAAVRELTKKYTVEFETHSK